MSSTPHACQALPCNMADPVLMAEVVRVAAWALRVGEPVEIDLREAIERGVVGDNELATRCLKLAEARNAACRNLLTAIFATTGKQAVKDALAWCEQLEAAGVLGRACDEPRLPITDRSALRAAPRRAS